MPTGIHDWIDAELAVRRERGLARALRTFGACEGAGIDFNGRGLINFASNDYLGLSADARVVEAATGAVRDFGWGATASPLVCGWREPHQALAEALAAFEETEAALVFPSGFAANMGAIVALVESSDAILVDRLSHASIIAGARLSGAAFRVFPHNDAARLDEILIRERARYRRVLVVTEGIFSMDGDVAPLADLAAVCGRHGAMLLVDEAHATGVLGECGGGAVSQFRVCGRVTARVGTLSKALGSIGGFVAGDCKVIELIRHRAPSFMFSTALPPAAAAAAHAALSIVKSEPERRSKLTALARSLRKRLGLPPSETPIIPVVVGNAARATELSAALGSAGLLVPAIRPPTVPRGTSRLRISLTSEHCEADLDLLVDALHRVDALCQE